MSALPFTILIPARMQSTRLPGKPLADIAGLPMVVRVARRVQGISDQVQVVVAADDPRVLQACEAHGVQALLTRDDHPSGSDRLAEAVTLLALPDDAIVVNVQGDEPLIDPALPAAIAAMKITDTHGSAGPSAAATRGIRALISSPASTGISTICRMEVAMAVPSTGR